MATFADVNPGDPWRPEPAARYNAVNAMVNRVPGGGEGTAVRLPANRGAIIVPAYWEGHGGEALAPYIAVELRPSPRQQNPGDPADCLYTITSVASSATSGIWGITQAKIPSGAWGSVLIGGLTAVSTADAVNTGDQLSPGSSGALVVAAGGTARAVTYGSGGGVVVAQLGTGGGAGGGAKIYVATQVPPGGVGAGEVREVIFTSNGSGFTLGATEAKFFCLVGQSSWLN